MADLRLTCALWDYDRTRALIDGRVKPDGIALEIIQSRPGQSFQRMLDTNEFAVSEMSLANYAMLKARGASPFIGLPIQISKMFRHSCIYVRKDAGITRPEDLKGKRVGTPQYTATGIVFMRGFLQHDYGVMPGDMHWFMGGLNKPGERPRLAADLPVPHDYLSEGQTLEAMLEAGELDALFANQIPTLFSKRSPAITRLFPDYKQVEHDYYRRTGIMPIMHLMVLRNDIAREHPWVAQSLCKAFAQARDLAVDGLYDSDALRLSLPFLLDHLEETRALFGEDIWPYGVEADHPSWAALCEYVHEQGLAQRLLRPEDLFNES